MVFMQGGESFQLQSSEGPLIYFGRSFYANNRVPLSDWLPTRQIIEVDPVQLLSLNRIDIGVKIKLAKHMLGKLEDQSAKIRYLETIRAFTNGSFREPGNKNKKSADSYLQSFWETISSMRAHGFRSSVIAVSETGSPVDGSHRLAAAIALNIRKVPIAFTNVREKIYDSEYFLRRGLDSKTVEKLVLDHVSFAEGASIFLSWPGNDNLERKRIHSFISSRATQGVAKLSLRVSRRGLEGIVLNVYASESWVGSPLNRYKGIRKKSRKVAGVFLGQKPLDIYVTEKIDESSFKTEMREFLRRGQDAIHSSDSTQEAKDLLSLLLSENSKILYRHGAPLKYKSTLVRIAKLKERQDSDTAMVVSSTVIGLLGLRKPNDLDFITYSESLANSKFELKIESHNHVYLGRYNHTLESLRRFIEDDSNYFVFNGIKFLSTEGLISDNKKRKHWTKKIDTFLLRLVRVKNAVGGPLLLTAFFIRGFREIRIPIQRFVVRHMPEEIKRRLRKFLS